MSIEALIQRREQILKAKAELVHYRRFIAAGSHADFLYEPARHHQVMCRALEELIDEDKYDLLLIMAPPGSAKSTYGSVQAATWAWAKYPQWNILCCSNTDALAKNFARRRRSVCDMEEWKILSSTELDPAQIDIREFANKEGGVMYARGAGSAIAGVRCKLLICDDLIASFEEASSPGQLDKLWEWYSTDARTRLVPTGKEIMIMTRWSRQDPIGRILERIEAGEEPKRVKILRLPMLCDDPMNDPMGREIDEPLWPEWFSDAQLQDNMSHPIRWPALYQQVPVDASGTWVDEEYIQYVDRKDVPDNCKTLMAMDLALTAGGGDYTVIGVAKIDPDRNIYLYDFTREQVKVSDTSKRLAGMNEQYAPPYVLADNDNATKVFNDYQREFARTGGDPVRIKELPLRGQDKEVRAAPIRDLFMQGKVFIVRAPWNAPLVHEIMNFPPKSKTEHDDFIDVIALIGRDVWTQIAKKPEEGKIAKPIEGAYIQREGQTFTRQKLDDLWEDPKKNRFGVLRL